MIQMMNPKFWDCGEPQKVSEHNMEWETKQNWKKIKKKVMDDIRNFSVVSYNWQDFWCYKIQFNNIDTQ